MTGAPCFCERACHVASRQRPGLCSICIQTVRSVGSMWPCQGLRPVTTVSYFLAIGSLPCSLAGQAHGPVQVRSQRTGESLRAGSPLVSCSAPCNLQSGSTFVGPERFNYCSHYNGLAIFPSTGSRLCLAPTTGSFSEATESQQVQLCHCIVTNDQRQHVLCLACRSLCPCLRCCTLHGLGLIRFVDYVLMIPHMLHMHQPYLRATWGAACCLTDSHSVMCSCCNYQCLVSTH